MFQDWLGSVKKELHAPGSLKDGFRKHAELFAGGLGRAMQDKN
jgi:hypothetical protein